MKIFVAGGTGVLGRAVLPLLTQVGHMVRATARGPEKMKLAKSLGAEPFDIDLYDMAAVRQAIAGADAIVRITTKFGPMSKLRDRNTWQDTIRLRTEGAQILVDAAQAEGVPTYLHESVTYVYADGGDAWLNENSPIDDAGVDMLRGTIKGERVAEGFSQAGGRGIVLRFGGFYGPDAPSTLETVEMIRRRLLFQMGPGNNFFPSIYVTDAARAVVAALNAPAGVYNVVDDDPVIFSQYLQMLAEALGAPRPRRVPKFVGRLAFGEIWKYFSRSQRTSNAKLKQATGWRPEVRSVREGWKRIAAELDQNRYPDSRFAA